MKLYAMPEPKVQILSEKKNVYLFGFHLETPEKWKQQAQLLNERNRLCGAKIMQVIEDSAYGEEGYRIRIEQERITIQTGGSRGMRYAVYMLMQAARTQYVPEGVIEDFPQMAMRGYQLNLRGPMRFAPVENLCACIRACGRAKINTLLVEYDTRLDHGKYQPETPWVLTGQELQTLQDCAAEEEIDLIPLIQTCGHLAHLLQQPQLSHIREDADVFDQLCPTNPDALAFVKELIDLYVEKNPRARYLHIGGDETRQLGNCPACAAYVKEHGKGGLYTHFMNQVIDYVCEKGLTPLVYDDMVCAHPEAMQDLDRRAVLVYWDYWTTDSPSRLLVARGGSEHAIVYDRSWEEENFAGVPDLQREILKVFGRGCDLEKDLEPAYLERYRPYLGEQFPRFVRSFPYLEYYQEQGFRVIVMPTSLGNTDHYLGAPNQARFTANIRAFAERAVGAKAMGMITSDWFPFPEAAYPFGITLAGQYSWGVPGYQEKYLQG